MSSPATDMETLDPAQFEAWAKGVALPADSAIAEPDAEDDPFPLDCLPPVVADMARAIADTALVPESLAACCVLGAASASIGRGLKVESGPDRTTGAGIYLAAVAPSGSGKSESCRHATAPVREFEAELIRGHEEITRPRLLAERAALEARLARLKQAAARGREGPETESFILDMVGLRRRLDEIEAQLPSPALIIEDATIEAQAQAMARNGGVISSISPEPGEVIANLLGRYAKGDRPDDGLYLKAYSGDPYTSDRIGRGRISIPEPWMSALWCPQPEKFQALLASRAISEGGLLARICCCDTGAEPRHIPDAHVGIPPAVSRGYRDILHALLRAHRMSPETRIIECSSDAREVLTLHFNGIVDRRLTDLRPVTSLAARWNEWAWRFAIIFHALRHGTRSAEHPLGVHDALMGTCVADWFSRQQLRLVRGAGEAALLQRVGKALDLARSNPDGITARDVQRARIEPTAEAARALLETCAARGHLSKETRAPGAGGHVVERYRMAGGAA